MGVKKDINEVPLEMVLLGVRSSIVHERRYSVVTQCCQNGSRVPPLCAHFPLKIFIFRSQQSPSAFTQWAEIKKKTNRPNEMQFHMWFRPPIRRLIFSQSELPKNTKRNNICIMSKWPSINHLPLCHCTHPPAASRLGSLGILADDAASSGCRKPKSSCIIHEDSQKANHSIKK